MKLRLLEIEKDFSVIKDWITDEKSHAMWCADLMHYPLEITNFKEVLFEAAKRFGDIPYVAVTDEGDVVIDPCFGSGSTARACIETKRNFYGFEINKEFYRRAKEEMCNMNYISEKDQIEGQLTLF